MGRRLTHGPGSGRRDGTLYSSQETTETRRRSVSDSLNSAKSVPNIGGQLYAKNRPRHFPAIDGRGPGWGR
jgi:hypothetical protein